ncbi:ABC-2 type transport system ATP-binding protein [Prauserella shujinwangii]|uniref:ABC-2 type transport system ATP-binding protein n=1 Tax=Prauserella shujinwangii TaxID=1453103 RepID=A0A2T0M1C4_9PSEU|nr:ATP-binding cassette domain-containing protein [Prauserella shujinwangii]PRX50385.1 ABC-2 type transport system ATP-binding protein [Prauserella shujinwangii]
MRFVVEGSAIGQRYRNHWVFRELNVSISNGVTVLLGPNGAGKTTLLDTVVTRRRPAGGSLKVLGLDATRLRDVSRIRQRTGYLPQQFGYPGGFTAFEFVRYVAWLKKVPGARIREAARGALARVELTEQADKPMKKLSGGMLRRAGIAQAIVHQPALVVLDEPSVGLDPGQRMRFRRTLQDLATEAAVVVSTHLVDDARVIADEIVVLDAGRIRFRGTAQELESRATADAAGDTLLERGYSTVLAEAGTGPD